VIELFLRPALLWGLAGVAVPVLIHLLGRRRVRTVPIATLRFLEKARARASARWRLRRLLLLLARAVALACLALLFAGPGCRDERAAAGPTSWVLLLDTSPSMAARRGGTSALERGKAKLLKILDDADPQDRFLFATTATVDRGAWARGFSADSGAVRSDIGAAEVEFTAHRVDRALERALRLLEGADGGSVALATDLQAASWPEGPVSGAERVPVSLLDVGAPDPANAWVVGLEEAEGGLRARVAAMGPVPVGSGRRTVRLRLDDGHTATAFVTGPQAVFQLRIPSRRYSGSVWVEPGGDLPLDDVLTFAARGASRVEVLLVNGDPRGFEIRDELFFVRRALAPGGRLGHAFRTREVRAADLQGKDLDGADLFFLANPGGLSEPLAAALRARVEAGAGLVVTAGDRWTGGGAGALTPLLAAPLRDVVVISTADSSRRPYEPLDPDFFEGPFAVFRDRSVGDLTGARVWEYRVLESTAGAPASVLMRLENGAPLVVERRLGRGRSVLVTTSIDRDGADLCLQPAFIPWLERLLLHAAGHLEAQAPSPVVAGEPVALPYEVPVAVVGPTGKETLWRPGAGPFVPPEPGLFRVRTEEGDVDAFAARVDPAESDLSRLTPEAVRARLGDGAGRAAARQPSGSGRRDVSREIASVLLAALALEALLSARLARRRAALTRGAEGTGG
jgi:hypothetical protein